MHRHKCANCGVVWRHGNPCRGNRDAHECPECGKECWQVFFGRERASYTNHHLPVSRDLTKEIKDQEPPF